VRLNAFDFFTLAVLAQELSLSLLLLLPLLLLLLLLLLPSPHRRD
jgi:hypothetical protein